MTETATKRGEGHIRAYRETDPETYRGFPELTEDEWDLTAIRREFAEQDEAPPGFAELLERESPPGGRETARTQTLERELSDLRRESRLVEPDNIEHPTVEPPEEAVFLRPEIREIEDQEEEEVRRYREFLEALPEPGSAEEQAILEWEEEERESPVFVLPEPLDDPEEERQAVEEAQEKEKEDPERPKKEREAREEQEEEEPEEPPLRIERRQQRSERATIDADRRRELVRRTELVTEVRSDLPPGEQLAQHRQELARLYALLEGREEAIPDYGQDRARYAYEGAAAREELEAAAADQEALVGIAKLLKARQEDLAGFREEVERQFGPEYSDLDLEIEGEEAGEAAWQEGSKIAILHTLQADGQRTLALTITNTRKQERHDYDEGIPGRTVRTGTAKETAFAERR